MKKRLLSLCMITSLVLAVGLYTRCETLSSMIQGPEFSLNDVKIKGISLSGVDLQLDASVRNPYPFDIPDAGFDAALELEGRHILDIDNRIPGGLAANESKDVPLDVTVPYAGLLSFMQLNPSQAVIPLRLVGNLNLPLPAEQRERIPGLPEQLSFPLEHERGIPALNPDIQIRNFEIHQPTIESIQGAAEGDASLADQASGYLNNLLSSGGLSPGSAVQAGLDQLDMNLTSSFEIVMSNNAAAAVNFENIDYTLMLQNTEFLSGTSSEIVNDGTTSVIKVETEFPLRSIGTTLANAIKYRSAYFALDGNAGFTLDSLSEDGVIPFEFNRTGRLTW